MERLRWNERDDVTDKIHCETSKIIFSSIRLRLLYSVGQQKSKYLVKEYKFVEKLSPSKILQTDFFGAFIFLNLKPTIIYLLFSIIYSILFFTIYIVTYTIYLIILLLSML